MNDFVFGAIIGIMVLGFFAWWTALFWEFGVQCGRDQAIMEMECKKARK